MSYQSPIDICETAEDTVWNLDKMVMNAVWKLGINVNQEELIEALKYDRDQYNKGYSDGYSAGREAGKKEALELIRDYLTNEAKYGHE